LIVEDSLLVPGRLSLFVLFKNEKIVNLVDIWSSEYLGAGETDLFLNLLETEIIASGKLGGEMG